MDSFLVRIPNRMLMYTKRTDNLISIVFQIDENGPYRQPQVVNCQSLLMQLLVFVDALLTKHSIQHNFFASSVQQFVFLNVRGSHVDITSFHRFTYSLSPSSAPHVVIFPSISNQANRQHTTDCARFQFCSCSL